MKMWKRWKAVLLAGMMACTAVAASVPAIGTLNAQAEEDTNNDDWLHAVGSRLYDKDGNEVWLTGANWFGFNCGENCLHYLWSGDVDDMLSEVADRGINVIRMPISTELLISWMNDTPNPVSSVSAENNPPYYVINPDFLNADKTMKNSMEIFDIIMQKCKKYGLKAFIDIHSPHTDNSGHNYNLWYGKETADGTMVTTDLWIETLTWLADKYKNDDTLIGYDLKNEPHGKGQEGATAAKWDGSTDENNWAYAATKCANSILDVNPNALIFVEGVEQYPKTEKGYTYDTADIWQAPADVSPWYGAWWGGNLRGVRDYPIQPDSGTSQIVYSPHDYGPSVYNQTWFDKDFTEQTLLDDYWYDTWAYVNAEDIAPLLIGEWGGHMDNGKNQQWMELLRDYMINHHINHTFWCLNTNSGDTGGLWAGIGYDQAASKTNLTWDADKYALFEKSLWQTLKTGKYIGLDHQKALGNNGTGLSLSEFYASYASTEGSNLDGGTIVDGNTTKPTTDTTKPSTTTTTITTTTTAAATTTEAPKTDVLGDINDDQNVTISDLVLLNRYLLRKIDGTDAAYAFDRGDVNGDKILNVVDATLYRQHLLGTLKKFPAE